MTNPSDVPNVKRSIIALLDGVVEADTATPADLVDRLPFARVTGRGGGRNGQVTARRLVDIDVFAGSEKACDDLADEVGSRVLGPHVVQLPGGAFVIDRIDEVSGPQIVPWSSARDVWRSAATYAIYTRSI